MPHLKGLNMESNRVQTRRRRWAKRVYAFATVVWLLVFGYLWSIWRRLARAERDLADVSLRVSVAQRR